MSNTFNVVYSVAETYIVGHYTNVRSYTCYISRLSQHHVAGCVLNFYIWASGRSSRKPH